MEYRSQQVADRDLWAAATRGPRRASLRGGVLAARPTVVLEETGR